MTETTYTLTEISELFNKSWFKDDLGWKTFYFFLYAPIGVLIFTVRFFISLQYLLMALVLPPSKFRLKCLRFMAAILGMTIKVEGDPHPLGKIIVANHITQFDHLAIHLVSSGVLVAKNIQSKILKFLGKSLALRVVEGEMNLESEEILRCENPIILFPEGTTTNGVKGLLDFSAMEIPQGFTIQPVSLKVSRIFLNPNAIPQSLYKEILAILFLPYTQFTLKFLPIQIAKPEGEWKVETQKSIADDLELTPTKLNASDKSEFVKKFLFRPPSLAVMTRSVQQQLTFQVPPEVILSSLERTKSVELTVKELKENASLPAPPSTFPKSAQVRMVSFQERKRIMIAAARQKYIQDHKIVIKNS